MADLTTAIGAWATAVGVGVAYLALRRDNRNDREERREQVAALQVSREADLVLVRELVLGRAARDGLSAVPALSVQIEGVRQEVRDGRTEVEAVAGRQREVITDLHTLSRELTSHANEDAAVQDALRRDLQVLLRRRPKGPGP